MPGFTLRQLDACFLQITGVDTHRRTDHMREAHGVMFLCPKCFHDNKQSPIGVHSVICWSKSAGTPADREPGPGRWKMTGHSLDDLSLDAEPGSNGARSVALQGGCGWHGFVNYGVATLA